MLPLLWHGTDTVSTGGLAEYDLRHIEKPICRLHRNALML